MLITGVPRIGINWYGKFENVQRNLIWLQDVWPFEGQNYEGWPTWIKKSYQEIIEFVFIWPI